MPDKVQEPAIEEDNDEKPEASLDDDMNIDCVEQLDNINVSAVESPPSAEDGRCARPAEIKEDKQGGLAKPKHISAGASEKFKQKWCKDISRELDEHNSEIPSVISNLGGCTKKYRSHRDR